MEHIPILKVEGCLLVSIQVDMHDQLATALQNDMTQKVVEAKARGVMIDISALEIVDSFIGRMLNNIAAMARVLDAVTVVVGMRPAVAITRVSLGLTIPGGSVELLPEALEDHGRYALRLSFSDRGPGIADVDRALSDGYTSGSGLGLGLGGARRLVNDFAIETEPGAGTTVRLTRWK